MRISLRWKLILFIVGPLIVISALVMWLTVGTLYEFSEQRLRELSIQRARNIAVRLDTHFQNAAQVAFTTANLIEKIPHLEDDVLYEFLKTNIENNSLIYATGIAFEPFVYYKDREYYIPHVIRGETEQDIEIPAANIYNYKDNSVEWYVKAKNKGIATWTGPLLDPITGNKLIERFSVPIHRDNDFIGASFIDIALDQLQKYLSVEYFERLPFIVISSSGRFIAHPVPEMVQQETIQHRASISEDPNIIKLGNEMLAGNTGVIRMERIDILDDQPYWVVYAPIGSTGWAFAAAISEVDLTSFANRQITRGMSGVAIMIFLIIICVLLVGTHITRPLLKLADGVSQLGKGNFAVKIGDIRSEDEVSDLANAFNEMVMRLKKHIRDLTREVASRESYESELRIAREMQSALLPNTLKPFPEHAEFDLSAVNATARQVGGDFFDYFFVSADRLIIVIADVSGKGTPAAIVMAVARTIIRNLAKTGASPAKILQETNRLLLETEISQVFVTFFIAAYYPLTGKIIYANAGHQPPYILNAEGAIKKFGQATGTIVGMLEDAIYGECEDELLVDEYLIAYTDGIPDARSPDGVFYGEAHFTSLLASCAGMTAGEICDIVSNEVTAFQAKSLADDMTLLVLKRNH